MLRVGMFAGRPVLLMAGLIFVGFALPLGLGSAKDMADMQDMGGEPGTMMSMMAAADAPIVPPVVGYSEGEQILFLHTEASDPEIADILTDMMGSPVLLVSSLAMAPADMVARVFVFTNGVKDEGPLGPLGYQPDVFEHPPDTDLYTPLREIVLVTWHAEASARLLTSALEVEDRLADGSLTGESTGIVVNMPMITWPGGQR